MATILIVDDQPENRRYLLTLLGYFGRRLLEGVRRSCTLTTDFPLVGQYA